MKYCLLYIICQLLQSPLQILCRSYLPNSSSQLAEEKNNWQCGKVANVAFSYLVPNLIILRCDLIKSLSIWSEKLNVFWKWRLHLFIISLGIDSIVVHPPVIVLPTVRKFQRCSPYWYSWIRKFCSQINRDKYSLRYFRNTNSQSESSVRGQAKLDFYVFKQSSVTELHFAGFKSNFLILDYWCLQKGKGTDGHKASKSLLPLFTCVGKG